MPLRLLALVLLVWPAPGQPPGPYVGQPYGGKPIELPGTIQAEFYDVAPDNAKDITFHYNGEPREGPIRATGDCIGLAKFGKGHVSVEGKAEDPEQAYAGWTHEGEWLKYTVHLAKTGTYQIGGKFASANTGTKISFSFTPDVKTGPLEVPTTAGKQPGVEVYHVWETLDNMAEVTLPAGDTVLTVKIESGAGINFDYFTLRAK